MDRDMIEENRNSVPYGVCVQCGRKRCIYDMSVDMVCLDCEPDEYSKHRHKARKCVWLCRKPSCDWVTCTHKDNPTAISSCCAEHCPI